MKLRYIEQQISFWYFDDEVERAACSCFEVCVCMCQSSSKQENPKTHLSCSPQSDPVGMATVDGTLPPTILSTWVVRWRPATPWVVDWRRLRRATAGRRPIVATRPWARRVTGCTTDVWWVGACVTHSDTGWSPTAGARYVSNTSLCWEAIATASSSTQMVRWDIYVALETLQPLPPLPTGAPTADGRMSIFSKWTSCLESSLYKHLPKVCVCVCAYVLSLSGNCLKPFLWAKYYHAISRTTSESITLI